MTTVPASDDSNGRTEVRLMMDYSVTMPLWDEWGQTDGEEWDLSPGLRRDLAAFAERWEANLPPDADDDRFDARPVRRSLHVAATRVVDLLTGRTRRWEAEAEAIRRSGQQLRDRLAAELGPDVRVTYVP